jgi:hypothetical protein
MENEFPAAGGGIDVFSEAFKADVSTVQISDSFDEVFEGATKAVEAPDDQGIPCLDVVEGIIQSPPFRFDPAYGVGEDFQATCCTERVLLEVEMLFCGSDPGVSDECHSPIVSKLSKERNM